ncbi:response regulator [Limimaricola pyoseonensis]|uniref:Response regulator receiver domain-containing protein n=1 Tax=Limimaricola pyoseonensis TaxID=521013 RepID=A0A1G7EHV8_9RHOB|nr:response regulator [Limimaricola pyoseonensis]SDE63016.1 Response regulator receiver domain-containing protein [Limimaricola pyoseonensis]
MTKMDGRSAPDTRPLAGRTVLVVEDEVLIAMDINESLAEAGAEVRYGRNLAQGLKRAEEHLDVALLDVTLGRSETCLPIVEKLRERGVPFVLHSGDLQRMGETISKIDAPVLEKPCDTSEILARLVETMRAGEGAGAGR